MPRPQHGPPCGLFINNACECIYIHKQRGGGGRGNRDAVSDLHMANKTVSHFGQLQSQNGWQRAQAAAEEEEQPKSRRQQNKTKRCTLRENGEERRETGNWLQNISMVQRSMQWNFWHLMRLFPFSGIAELKELRIIPDIYGVTIVTEKSYFGSLWKSLITVYNSSKFLQKWNRKIIR